MSILIVVAHPDDEVFLFGGSAMRAKGAHVVICTDGSWKANKDERYRKAKHASQLFGWSVSFLDFKDDYTKHLDVPALIEKLRAEYPDKDYEEVWTHSPTGDYMGHWHHSDVAFACSQVYTTVFYHAFGLRVDRTVLTEYDYRAKCAAASKAYPEEVGSFFVMFDGFVDETKVKLRKQLVSQIYLWLYDKAVFPFVTDFDCWKYEESKYEEDIFTGCMSMVDTIAPVPNIIEIGANTGRFSKLLTTRRRGSYFIVEPAKRYVDKLSVLATKVYPSSLDIPMNKLKGETLLFFINTWWYLSPAELNRVLSWGCEYIICDTEVLHRFRPYQELSRTTVAEAFETASTGEYTFRRVKKEISLARRERWFGLSMGIRR